MSPSTVEDEGVPIAAVEQATGIARATLRIWERRYGFPQPGRDPRGERSYPDEQVRKLRLIADLMARGHRPGRLVQLNGAQLAALAGPAAERSGRASATAAADPVLQPVRAHDLPALLSLLARALESLGPVGFVTGRLPQMNANVGLAWERGEIEVYEEHLYTEAVQQVLRPLIAAHGGAEAVGRPRVLLATFPQEAHGLGLLMAQTLFALDGCACTSLGTGVPIRQIVAAAAAVRADIVGLSFSPSMNPAQVLRGLAQLRGELPAHVAIWAGGTAPVLARHRVDGVQAVPDIAQVPALIAGWRAAASSRA